MASPDRMRAMHDAIIDGNLAKVRLLLKAGAPADGVLDKMPFVTLAAMLVKEDVFELLVASGASLSTPELLEYSVDGGGGRLRPSLAIVRRVLEGAAHDPATINRTLRFACVSGSPQVVQLLLAQGADPNERDPQSGESPLDNAVEHGRQEVVEVLLAAGAKPGSSRGR